VNRTGTFRVAGWLAVAAILAAAFAMPSGVTAAPLDGAIWTSTSDGTTVNANIYAAKTDVYLNGGPQNCGTSNGLPDGDYYFQVTDPSNATLLSTDAIRYRQVQVVNGVIAGVSGDGNHAEGAAGCKGGLPVQLMPFDDTPNNGGEYSVDFAPKVEVDACEGFSPDATTLNFMTDCRVSSKNDNFKVGATPPSTAPSAVPPSAPSEGPPSVASQGPTGEVGGITGNPETTPPPTDQQVRAAGPSTDSWRLVLFAIAGLVGAALLVSPATGTKRNRR
jgi:hypothetical protein